MMNPSCDSVYGGPPITVMFITETKCLCFCYDTSMTMHANEVTITTSQVQKLVVSQFPEYIGQPIKTVSSSGTDNAMYRLGDSLVIRLPRVADKERNLKKEYEWLPKIAPYVTLAIPTPIGLGKPDDNYPFGWAIYTWLEGDLISETELSNIDQDAIGLADFITSLQKIDTANAPQPKGAYDRGAPLLMRDPATRKAIAALSHIYDTKNLSDEWQKGLDTTPWDKKPLWIHGDLDGRNMLAVDGCLAAVIDFGSLSVGDPAYDVMIAWKIFSGGNRQMFRERLKVDDDTWARSRSLVISQAAMILSYYTIETNPTLVKEAQKWMNELGFRLR
jgi:aminoglycoside phosphotransferase (APT) family kinase protein